MAPASSFLISGIFLLSDGSRSTNPPYYAQYLSALDFLDPEPFINISIRKYTPPSEPLCTEDTVVFLVAKAALPAGEDGMLDTIHCTPFQSSWENFQGSLPSGPTHTASVAGTIGAISNVGVTRSFMVNASEYVRDERRGFTIRFQFEADSGRWKNLRLPPTGSTIIATGAFKGVADDGHGEPILTLLDVSFGVSEAVVASPTRTIGHRRVGKNANPGEQPPLSSSPPPQPTAEVSDDIVGVAASTSKRSAAEVEEAEESLAKRGRRTRRGRTKTAN